MNEQHTIWSNHNLDFNDFKHELEVLNPGKSEDELISIMYETNDDFLNDERDNLNIQLPREILIIADIGRWNGRFLGYNEISSGNISDCLYSEGDYNTWYVDKLGDIRCDAVHHDGTNHLLYRTYKPNATITQIENLKNKIYNDCVTRSDITKFTNRLGDEIGKVYGWDFDKPKQYEKSR